MIYFEALLCGNTLLKQRSIQYAMTDLEEEKKGKKEVSKLLKNLDHTDYTLLEGQRTTNLLSGLHIGFEKMLDSSQKLFRCGLVQKLKRKLTFSEKEKLERKEAC